jgi:hypothetical protein
MDSTALISLHEDILRVDAEDSGKESRCVLFLVHVLCLIEHYRYKRRILFYLLSHVTAWSTISLRLALLASTSSVQEASKLSLVAPLIQELSTGSTESLLVGLDQTQRQVYINGLLSGFRYMEAPSATGPMGLVFPALLELVRKALSEPEEEMTLHEVPSTMKMVLPALQTSQRLDLSQLLLSMSELSGQVCCVSASLFANVLTAKSETNH